MIDFLQDLLNIYEKHGVKAFQDYDYAGYSIGDTHFDFNTYDGEGYMSIWPRWPDREVIQELGDRLFSDDITKAVQDRDDADEIVRLPDDAKIHYDLRITIYPDKVIYEIGASAYNPKTNEHERRFKEISKDDLS